MFCARQRGWKDAASAGALGISTTDVPIWRRPENFCANSWGVLSFSKINNSEVWFRVEMALDMMLFSVWCWGKLCDDVNHFNYKDTCLFVCLFIWLVFLGPVHMGHILAFKTRILRHVFQSWTTFNLMWFLMLQDGDKKMRDMVSCETKHGVHDEEEPRFCLLGSDYRVS